MTVSAELIRTHNENVIPIRPLTTQPTTAPLHLNLNRSSVTQVLQSSLDSPALDVAVLDQFLQRDICTIGSVVVSQSQKEQLAAPLLLRVIQDYFDHVILIILPAYDMLRVFISVEHWLPFGSVFVR